MAGSDDSVPRSLTPDEETAVKEILGYLNFSSGTADSRFQKNLDRLHAWFAPDDRQIPIRRLLADHLEKLAAASPAFQNNEQARAVMGLAFDHVLDRKR